MSRVQLYSTSNTARVHELRPGLCQCAINANAAHLRIGYAGPRVGHGQGLQLLQRHIEWEAG